MWQSISFLLWAEDGEEAKDFATGHVDDLVENGAFDYASKSGPEVVAFDSQEGPSLVAQAWQSYRNAFEHNLEELRRSLGRFSNEEILEEKEDGHDSFPGKTRYLAHLVGEYYGPETTLYGHEGQGIRTSAEMKSAIGERPKAWPKNKLWVVSFGVHF